MFNIWEVKSPNNQSIIGERKSAFDSLSVLVDNEIQGSVKDKDNNNIVTWSKELGTIWQKFNPATSLPSIQVKDAAYLLGLSQSRVHQFCQSGRLGSKFGKSWAITLSELEEFSKVERRSGIGFNQKKKEQR